MTASIASKSVANSIRNLTADEEPRPYRPETVTSELIYYWMVGYNIPFTCEEWHLNRLLNLIRICHIKNGPQKKASPAQTAARYREMNERRKRELGTKG